MLSPAFCMKANYVAGLQPSYLLHNLHHLILATPCDKLKRAVPVPGRSQISLALCA